MCMHVCMYMYAHVLHPHTQVTNPLPDVFMAILLINHCPLRSLEPSSATMGETCLPQQSKSALQKDSVCKLVENSDLGAHKESVSVQTRPELP